MIKACRGLHLRKAEVINTWIDKIPVKSTDRFWKKRNLVYRRNQAMFLALGDPKWGNRGIFKSLTTWGYLLTRQHVWSNYYVFPVLMQQILLHLDLVRNESHWTSGYKSQWNWPCLRFYCNYGNFITKYSCCSTVTMDMAGSTRTQANKSSMSSSFTSKSSHI